MVEKKEWKRKGGQNDEFKRSSHHRKTERRVNN